MKMFDRIMLRLKNHSLEKATEKQRNSAWFATECVKQHGVKEFQMASVNLKSDAKFILDMVAFCPECLAECENEIYDRYEVNGEMVELPVGKTMFAALCCQRNVNAFKYLPTSISKQYLEAVQQEKVIQGQFQGEKVNIVLKNDKDYVDLLKYVRFGFMKSDSFYVSCLNA